MDPQSNSKGPSLRKKSVPQPWAPTGTRHRVYSPEDRARFFEALQRRGSIAAAALELGFNQATCTMWADDPDRISGTPYTSEQKTEFLAVLDRLGGVAKAAKSLGINVQTAFSWAYSTGAVRPTPPATPTARQLALAPQKEAFLALLPRVGNISEASRQVGVKTSQGASWARSGGFQNVPWMDGKPEEYARLRRNGVTPKDAAARLGVNRKTAYRWDRAAAARTAQRTATANPDLAYNNEVTTIFAEPATVLHDVAGMEHGPELPPSPAPRKRDLEDLERVIDPRYLSRLEREQIGDRLRAGESLRAIARALGRSPGSISREVERNSHPTQGYQPYGAQRASVEARGRSGTSKLALPGRLRKYVVEGLRNLWSPEQISHTLIKDFPDDPSMRVSTETIYQAIYVQARGGLNREVAASLRTGRTRRKKHKNPEERTPRFRDAMVNISERPAEVEDRAVPGHWEGDLVRHEALFYRAEVEDLRRCAVAAA